VNILHEHCFNSTPTMNDTDADVLKLVRLLTKCVSG
jgi:hypothetical protein